MTNAQAQYALVQSARGALLDYCATLAPAHFVAPVAAFNNSSIRDLLAHAANCYRYWLSTVAQGRPRRTVDPATVPDVAALRQAFAAADATVAEFIQQFDPTWLTPQPFAAPHQAEPLQLTPLALFTHVIMHEFHHKGQVLTMSRHLGYLPPDTDVIRT